MSTFFTKYQTIIVFVVIVAALYFGYQFFFAAPTGDALTVTTNEDAGTAADQDLIALLLELKGIRLDNSIFTDPLFQSLNDFGKDLIVEPVGRTNPFAPLGGAQLPAAPKTTPVK